MLAPTMGRVMERTHENTKVLEERIELLKGIAGETVDPLDGANAAWRYIRAARMIEQLSPEDDLLVIVDDTFGTITCLGDGTGTLCPCGNLGGIGEGCANSSGVGAALVIDGSASASADDLTVAVSGLLPGRTALLFSGTASLNDGNGITFGDGLRCADGNLKRLGIRIPDGQGDALWGPGLAAEGEWIAGDTITIQAWYRDQQGSPCGLNFNTSHGFEFVVEP